MPAISRQKACIPCANSKRRCDKQLPECQRCLDRDVDCEYPKPKGRRREPPARHGLAESFVAFQGYADTEAVGAPLDLGDWDAMGHFGLDVSMPDMLAAEAKSPTAASPDSLSSPELSLDSSNAVDRICPWFLKDETWDVQRRDPEQSCELSISPETVVDAVHDMLHSWVDNGYNGFIHRQLYLNGLPTCLQDAFTTYATYRGCRNSAVKQTVLQIAEERMSALLASQNLTSYGSPHGLLAHLARVQALFVFQYIRLFDGSVRQRALAERQIPTLKRWVVQLWEAARRYRVDEHDKGPRLLQLNENELDRTYDATAEMWRSWILTESVRRTQLVVSSTLNMYEIMKGGWSDCPGGIMLTTRRGLWEAGSATKWLELCRARPPLLIPSSQPRLAISKYAASEFDEFALLYWSFVIGPDKVKCWVDQSSREVRVDPLPE